MGGAQDALRPGTQVAQPWEVTKGRKGIPSGCGTETSDGARPLGTCLVSPWSMPGAVLGAGPKAMSKTDAVPTFVRRGGSCDLAAQGRKYRELSEHRGHL